MARWHFMRSRNWLAGGSLAVVGMLGLLGWLSWGRSNPSSSSPGSVHLEEQARPADALVDVSGDTRKAVSQSFGEGDTEGLEA